MFNDKYKLWGKFSLYIYSLYKLDDRIDVCGAAQYPGSFTDYLLNEIREVSKILKNPILCISIDEH